MAHKEGKDVARRDVPSSVSLDYISLSRTRVAKVHTLPRNSFDIPRCCSTFAGYALAVQPLVALPASNSLGSPSPAARPTRFQPRDAEWRLSASENTRHVHPALSWTRATRTPCSSTLVGTMRLWLPSDVLTRVVRVHRAFRWNNTGRVGTMIFGSEPLKTTEGRRVGPRETVLSEVLRFIVGTVKEMHRPLVAKKDCIWGTLNGSRSFLNRIVL